MQKFIPFDSRNTDFKNPFGSVCEGTDVHFSVNLPRSMGCTGVTLVIYEDGREEQQYYDLFWRSTDHITEWWECDFVPKKAGLYRYFFEYNVSWGPGRIYAEEGGRGCFSGSRDPWQLTVYEKDYKTPDWLKGGIIYQIFPDRFYCSGEEKKNVPSDRILRSDRDGIPAWRPDENGIILNNDYFCGDLKGIEKKLPYIRDLGVTCIYLNPIFEAQSNHRYDTSDYLTIDPLLGTEEDFRSLCAEAKKLGIAVIFDGVFSHTGADSIYFNKFKRYGDGGAYNDDRSVYRSWYSFGKTKDDYASWWGIDILPEVNENDPSFTEFITGEHGVIQKWLDAGACGVRLDVADELPDEFIDRIRRIVKKNGRDCYLLGEVWEDATNKFSWGCRRRYLLGQQLDSVMNYPFREAIISFVRDRNAGIFMEKIMQIVENYPAPSLHTAMNHLGTHDTERILTALSDLDLTHLDRERQSKLHLTERQRNTAIRRLKAAAMLQYTLPGVPSLYYGDEAAMEGGKDPFNRGFYPWEHADPELIAYFKSLGRFRRSHGVFADGNFIPLSATMQCAAFVRENDREGIAVIVNLNEEPIRYYVNYPHRELFALFGCTVDGACAEVPAMSCAAVQLNK